ncbi:MAG TPA: phosphopantothenoylcysteine decarboxylase, partial [Solirubrobacteraceae bacterium]|nr:phosphopantothenoylcysteine decarboxylase [Solirubrobacteraceae bacterium]
RGAAVVCVAANVVLDRNPAVEYVDVETAQQLARACDERFGDCDLLLMAAAVADYRPAAAADTKIKKDAASLELALERTGDVLSGLAARRREGQTLVGFAAEHGDDGAATEAARGKLERKGVDAVVLNDISRPDIGFDAADNEVTIVTAAGERKVPRASKGEVAAAILDVIQDLLIRDGYNSEDGAPGAPGAAGPRRAG